MQGEQVAGSVPSRRCYRELSPAVDGTKKYTRVQGGGGVGDCHARSAVTPGSSGPGNSVMYNSRVYHHRGVAGRLFKRSSSPEKTAPLFPACR